MSIVVAILLGLGFAAPQAVTQPAQKRVHALAIHRAETQSHPDLEPIQASYGQLFWMHHEPDLDDHDVQKVEFVKDSAGVPAIKLTFTPEGTARFRRLTREHLNRRLIFLVQGRFVMDPVVTEEATSDFTLITGHVTKADAKALRAAIKKQH